ncbi:50S ribosomal protein L21, chloroplastic-like [Cucurbita pepo subsp. pepo]|uniref:50S ribosomal protein L21, chloroplastic-like n=1 Tax=Cucurbita pepo subsp. pepo TaxID=3664 RepID=UPI000C9D70B2|nr:50S ribosomal protein L21, chloroplastic-like [Cucurbita pepo subsp. pepo]
MASLTLSLCANFATHCRISTKQNTPLSTPISSSFKLSPSSRPALSFVLKSSESEAAVIDSEPAASQIVEVPSEQAPKREEIFAVVMIGSRQYIVFPGRYIHTQRLKGANVNDKITLNKVLLVGTKTQAYIGKPIVTNAAVHAVVEEQGLDKKVIVFKYKKKKNYRRNIGHRQPNTRIRITEISGYQDYPAATLES